MANIPSWVYKLLIVLATIIWGFSFVVMKDVVTVLPPAWLLGMRFLFAGALLLVILRKRVMRFCSRKVVTYGLILGALDFTAFWLQTVGLKHTTPGINAFLTATYCVLVPFAWWLIARKRPTAFNIVAAIVAVCGIWLVSVSSSGETLSIGFGEAMTLGCAVAFAAHIVAVSKFAQKCDALVLTVFQFIAEGALGIVFGAATETFPGCRGVHPRNHRADAVPRGVRVRRCVRHPERVARACATHPGVASLEPGIGVWRGVFHPVVWRADDVAPCGGLCADLCCYSDQRDITVEGEAMSEKNNIVLIGMPGAGKSTLGIVLAKIVGYDFIDADLVIQNQCDKTLQKLLDACGPEGFIAVENQVLSDLKAERSVIATGGSAVYSDEAMKHLSEIGHVVYLQISYDELKSRLSDLQERGVVLKNGVGMSLHELFDERKPLYEKYAEVTVNVDDLTITAAARKVASALKGLVPEA